MTTVIGKETEWPPLFTTVCGWCGRDIEEIYLVGGPDVRLTMTDKGWLMLNGEGYRLEGGFKTQFVCKPCQLSTAAMLHFSCGLACSTSSAHGVKHDASLPGAMEA